MTYLTVINKSNNVYTVRQVVTIICNTRDAEARCTRTHVAKTSQLATLKVNFLDTIQRDDAFNATNTSRNKKKMSGRLHRELSDELMPGQAEFMPIGEASFSPVRLCGPARNISIACYSKCTLSYSLVSPILFNPRCLMASGPFLIAFKNRLFFRLSIFYR